jgi:hypothetical protein
MQEPEAAAVVIRACHDRQRHNRQALHAADVPNTNLGSMWGSKRRAQEAAAPVVQ